MSVLDGVSQCWWLNKTCVINWDAWAAGGTLLAVVVALISSKTALREASRIREEERLRVSAAEHEKAVATAVVLDQEIYLLGSEIRRVKHGIAEMLPLTDGHEVARWLRREMPKDPLPMLTRVADRLERYGTHDSARLLIVLSSWYTLRDPVDPAKYQISETEVLGGDIHSIYRAFGVFLDKLREARIVTMRWASEIRPDLPPTDW